MRGKVKRSALTSMLLAPLLCAACTTVSADHLPEPRKCSRYTNLFLETTEHARPPADDSSKEWVNFATAEAGQLEIANRDKQLARQVGEMCEQEGAEARERALKAIKPWYRKIF